MGTCSLVIVAVPKDIDELASGSALVDPKDGEGKYLAHLLVNLPGPERLHPAQH